LQKVGNFLLKKVLGIEPDFGAGKTSGNDLIYHLRISRGQAKYGDVVQVNLPHFEKSKMVSLRIPPGVNSGTRLRLKKMGNFLPGGNTGRGDVYIVLHIG
jgi:DnaJ-class molecular chaperone